MKSKKGKIASSGKPRRRKRKQTVSVQYGVLPYRFSQDAALEILVGYNAGDRRWIVPKAMADQRVLSPAKSAARRSLRRSWGHGENWPQAHRRLRLRQTAR